MAHDPVQEFADRLGFGIGNNPAFGKTKIAYGVHNDVVFNVALIDGMMTVTALTGPQGSAQTETVKAFLKENRKVYGIQQNYTVFGAKAVSVRLLRSFGVKSETIFLFVDAFSQFLRQLGFSHGCSVCGKPGDHPYCSAEEYISMVCEPCYLEHQNNVENIRQEREVSGSYLSGAVGAFFGALIGVIPWMLIGMLGYLAAVCGYAMAWLAFKGYKLMNGKFGKGAIVIIIVVLLVMTPVAVVASNAAIAAKDGTLAYFDNNIIYLIAAFFLIPEVLSSLLGEFALGLLFTGLGAYSFLRKVNRTTTGKDLEMVRM